MARSTCRFCLAFLSMFIHFIYLAASIPTPHKNYPSGSLACKTYEMTKMDCSNRNLPDIPVLDQNLTALLHLDLSHNNLLNITSSPFGKLKDLMLLNLSYNEISQMSSTSFRGMQSLKGLDLQVNKLVELPKDIFADLFHLIYLNMDQNYFTAIPGYALASLYSLQAFSFTNLGVISEIDFEGFQNMKCLDTLIFDTFYFCEKISGAIFYQLEQLPIRDFVFLLRGNPRGSWRSRNDIFSSLNNITSFVTMFGVLPGFTYLNSPLQTLALYECNVDVANKTSFQVLQTQNTSLKALELFQGYLRRIEDYTFIWTPNLLTLYLAHNQIHHLAKNAFYGLNILQTLDLSINELTEVPFGALEVFRNSASLQSLGLKSNRVTGLISETAFNAVSISLTYLKVGYIYSNEAGTKNFDINWLGSLQNLKYCSLTSNNPDLAPEVFINSKQLSSLRTFKIRNFFHLDFPTQICTLFPSLEVVALPTSANLPVKAPVLDMLEAFLGCSHLKELDLSGTISVIQSSDIKHLNITMSTLETLKLAQNKIPSIQFLSFINAPKLVHLDLADNLLETVDSEIAYMYPDLISLDIQDNELESLSGLEHLVFLQILNAAGNKITEVPPWLLSEARNLEVFDLSNNPFQCTCAIEPFQNWILSDKQTWLQPGEYVCATPENLKGTSVTAIKLDCKPKTAFNLSIIIPSVLLFCIMFIFLIRYRWHIKYKLFLLYRHYRPFPDIDEDFEMLQLQYHAYVAYDENSAVDEAWVMDDLKQNMEQGPDPIKLCIKSRDFIPGRFLLDNIDESIHQSRKTILVLSPNFVECEWCYQEMQMAQMRLLDDNLDVLVLVLLNDIPENKMTLLLRKILCRKEYLKWPKDRAGQRLFWQRLREELKSPVQVNRCFYL